MIWWFLAVLAIPGFFIWILAHEGAHALTHLAQKRKVLKFIPWPHRSKISGNLLFGEVVTDGQPNTFSSLAPYVLDVITFISCFIGILFVTNPYAWTALLLGLFCPAVNTMVAIQARIRLIESADLKRVEWKYALTFYYLLLGYIAAITWIITS